ncbi:MAG: MFS transporter [Chloroflexi bacterium]|nr:MFS transporter [Chloroflexota bacterium]
MSIADNRAPGKPGRSYYGWVVLGVVFLTLFTAVTARGIITLFIAPWSTGFGWAVAAITVALSIQLVVSGPAAILAGGLTDRFGPKRVFTGYLAAAVVGILGIAAMTELWQLYLFFGLFLGFGATLHSITTPLIAKWFRKGRGLALGIVQEGDLLGLAALAPVILALNTTMSWRVSWWAIGLVTLVVIIPLAWILIRPSPAESRSVGTEVTKKGTDLPGATLRQASHTRSFWMLLVSNFFCGVTARFFWLLLAPIAMEGGMSTAQVALTVSIAGISALPGMLLFGAACERFGRTTLLGVNFIVRSVSFAIMASYLWTHEPVLMFVGAAITGFLTRSSAPPFSVAMINCFGLRSLGSIIGVASTVHQVGGALSLFIAGYVFDHVGSYAPTLVAGSILLVVAAVIAGRTPEKKCYADVPDAVPTGAGHRLATNVP